MKQTFKIIVAMVVAANMAECATPCIGDHGQDVANISVATSAATLSAQTIIDVRDCGASPTNLAAQNTAIIQACIDSLQAGQTLMINERYRILGLCLDNKDRIRISGDGGLVLSGANPNAMIFELRNNIHDIQIDSLELIGDNEKGLAFAGNRHDRDAYLQAHYATRPDMSDAELANTLRIITDNSSAENVVYHQAAIGNYSGDSLSIHNVVFKDLLIRNINVGISLNADLGGEYGGALIVSNKLVNLLGAAPGQGYGIHLACATNCRIKANTIENASRHAIYHAKTRSGMDSETIIQDNSIFDHRKSVALSRVAPGEQGWIRAAMEVTRSRSVLIHGNTFNMCHDTCLNISRDTEGGFACANITVINNKFSARCNDSPYINIGEQLASSNYPTENIAIVSNAFEASCVGYDVQILQGKNIKFACNTFARTDVSGGIRFVRVGVDRYISAPSDIDQITFVGNGYSAPSDNANTLVYDIDPAVGAGGSVVNISKNSVKKTARSGHGRARPSENKSSL